MWTLIVNCHGIARRAVDVPLPFGVVALREIAAEVDAARFLACRAERIISRAMVSRFCSSQPALLSNSRAST